MPDPTAIPDVTQQLTPIQQLIEFGGPVMVVLLALAVLGTATFIYAMLVGAVFAPRTDRRLKAAVDRWKRSPSERTAAEVLDQKTTRQRFNPMHALINTTMRGLLRGQTDTQIREDVARLAQKALQPFESPLKIIEVIAALAPLLGLLGTVMGMMEAFSAMASAEGRASASQLSGGIYQALMTTAAGLVIAIPLAAIAAWMEFRLRRINTHMNDLLVQVLSASTRQDTPEPVTPTVTAAPGATNSETEANTATGEKRFAHATG
ncbi:MotA/TolQ/ExbB proton channel family protein [Marinobacter sp. BGYM27]|uniref:MotA/TolQ/ExbB proton channel family protein n=1 Tax=Marinobacter sp. BGYM27 TaxID=2975597 RepID=UPI00325FA917